MYALLNLFNTLISIYIWLLIASVVLSWLIAFNVVNTGNRFVYQIRDFLYRITEPVLRPIRNLLPNLGGIDISPVILILALYFIRDLAFELLAVSLRSPLSVRGDGIELAVKATPRAGRTAIDGVVVDAAGVAWLAVRLTAPADRWSCQRGSAGGLWPRAWASLRRPADRRRAGAAAGSGCASMAIPRRSPQRGGPCRCAGRRLGFGFAAPRPVDCERASKATRGRPSDEASRSPRYLARLVSPPWRRAASARRGTGQVHDRPDPGPHHRRLLHHHAQGCRDGRQGRRLRAPVPGRARLQPDDRRCRCCRR